MTKYIKLLDYARFSLNAPDGAGCSLTVSAGWGCLPWAAVLMHLMVLGAP